MKVLNLLCQGIVLIFLLAFIYGRFYTSRIDTMYFIIFVLSIEILDLIIYYILRTTNKGTYIFCKDKINKYKHNNLIFSINNIEIDDIYYIRIKWIFFMQFGSGSLIIRYKNGSENKNIYISMSLKDIKKIGLVINKKILIK